MRKPTTWKQSEKTRHHKSEAKRERRKARKKKITPEQQDIKEWNQVERVLYGEMLLKKFLEPIVEASLQREIEENIVSEKEVCECEHTREDHKEGPCSVCSCQGFVVTGVASVEGHGGV